MVGISVEPLVVIEGLTPAAQVLTQSYHHIPIKVSLEYPNDINCIFICRRRPPTCPLSWSSVRKRLRAFSITAQGSHNLSLIGLNLLSLKMARWHSNSNNFSFAMAPADTHSRPTEQFVPLSVLQQW